jgi:4,4'-diaponeurosporenoate glycosyltransferase
MIGASDALLLSAVLAAGVPRALIASGRLSRRHDGHGSPAPARTVRAEDVSIIIPARNEAHRLPRFFASLGAAGAVPREVIVVDDHSTDDTAAVAQRAGARVVTPPAHPDGWIGKTFACATGAAAATGTHLLFLDADTWFEPGGFAALLAGADPDAAWSVGPYHRVERPYEWMSLYFHVMMVAGTLASRHGMFGQALLVPRASYEAAGGHAAVRQYILENTLLGERLRRDGVRVVAVPGRGRIAMRMYPDGIGDLTRGWMKSFSAGASATPAWLLMTSVVWMGGGLVATGTLFALPWSGVSVAAGVAAVAALAHAVELQRVARRIGNYPWPAVIAFPVALVFFQVVFAAGALLRALGRGPRWKARTVGST